MWAETKAIVLELAYCYLFLSMLFLLLLFVLLLLQVGIIAVVVLDQREG